LAQWNLEVAAEIVNFVGEHWPGSWQALSRRLGIEPEESHTSGNMSLVISILRFDEQTGLFEQFRGYFDLEEIDLATFEPRTAPIDVLLGRERIQRSKIIKQPDDDADTSSLGTHVSRGPQGKS